MESLVLSQCSGFLAAGCGHWVSPGPRCCAVPSAPQLGWAERGRASRATSMVSTDSLKDNPKYHLTPTHCHRHPSRSGLSKPHPSGLAHSSQKCCRLWCAEKWGKFVSPRSHRPNPSSRHYSEPQQNYLINKFGRMQLSQWVTPKQRTCRSRLTSVGQFGC